jgi:DNA-binding NarL/FixJ family response regulator
MQPKIRLIIADDHAVFRQGLKMLLAVRDDMEVVAEIDRAQRLLPTVTSVQCDVLLLDLQMDRWVLAEIESLARITSVCVLTASERIEDSMEALRIGAKAIVQKRFAVETLTQAIRTVADGLVWVPPILQAEITRQISALDSNRLTARELDIARCVATGLRNSEIGSRLSISEGTVKTHINRIFQKLGLRDRVELALYALREHLAGEGGERSEGREVRSERLRREEK